MRQRLRASGSRVSPRSALTVLRQIQQHRVDINHQSITGMSRLHPEQRDLFKALQLSAPTEKATV
jgi:hypothetical protein